MSVHFTKIEITYSQQQPYFSVKLYSTNQIWTFLIVNLSFI